MKRIALLFISLCLSITINAQSESAHMTFAGIPLTGTINQFQTKLQAKGYVINKNINSILPVGTRSFNGTFIGKKANIAVYYDPNSKNVYAAKAYFTDMTEEKVKEEFNNVKGMLSLKYVGHEITDGTKNQYPTLTINTNKGTIFVYIMKDELTINYPYIHSLHIEYHDFLNGLKHRSNVMDDL
jgi:hypothetical protein